MIKSIAAVLGLGLAFAALAAEPPEPNATLRVIQGQVAVNEGSGFLAGRVDQRLKPGDRVMVQDQSTATIVFDDDCRLDIEANKLVTVPDRSTCAGAALVQQGLNPAGNAAIGGTVGNGGVGAMIGGVGLVIVLAISNGEDEIDVVSP